VKKIHWIYFFRKIKLNLNKYLKNEPMEIITCMFILFKNIQGSH
jgi:hypothetical protein